MSCFVITGEYITQQARTFWAEDDDPPRALRLLQSLDGITEGQCLDILEGRCKLIGNSSDPGGVQLVSDDQRLPTLADVLGRYKRERDDARNDTASITQMHIGDVVGVASPRGLIMVPRRDTKQGKGGRLCLRDGLDWEGAEHDDKDWVEPRYYQETESSSRNRSVAALRPNTYPGTTGVEEPQRPPPVPDAKITSGNGWLSPEGQFYGCRYGGHNDLAEALDVGHDELRAKNWMKLQERDGGQDFFPDDYEQITEPQKAAVAAYCVEMKLELPWWLGPKEEEEE